MSLLCLVLAACGGGGEQGAPADSTAVPATAVPQIETLSDTEALAVLMALSAAGSETASALPEVVAAPELRRYLAVVRADHQALQAELQVIADSLQLTPQPHAAAERIRALAEASTLRTEAGSGSTDEVAVQEQIRLHELFLTTLDSAVLRGGRAELLAQYARALRPTVSAHLQRAEQLQRLLRERPASPVPRAVPGASRPDSARTIVPDTMRQAPPDTVPGG